MCIWLKCFFPDYSHSTYKALSERENFPSFFSFLTLKKKKCAQKKAKLSYTYINLLPTQHRLLFFNWNMYAPMEENFLSEMRRKWWKKEDPMKTPTPNHKGLGLVYRMVNKWKIISFRNTVSGVASWTIT